MAKYKRGSLTLARQVFNTPQLILADDLQNIAQYLVNRANGMDYEVETKDVVVVDKEARTQLTEQEERERTWRNLGITNDGKRGNLEVTGTLVAKAGEIDADCMELTSYEKLYTTFAKQVSEGIEELVLHVDSGGGSAFTCFEMAREVKALAVENNVKIYAYVDGLSASAAYAWTSIADEIIARPDSEVGSVGVVVQLINNSKMLENIGITRQFVYHGDQKIPFTDTGEFSPQFISSIQKKVDKTGLEFNTFIALNRNMSVEDVIATQAEVFDSETALKVGFIDKIMTKSEFFNDYLPNASSNQNQTYFLKQEDNMADVKELQTQLSAANEEKQQLADTLSGVQSQLAELTEAKESLSTELTALKEAKESLVAEKAALEAEKLATEKQARLDSRTAKLEASLGKDNEKVAELLTTTESLSDEQFEVIASSFGVAQEAKQDQFAEKGGEGQQSNTQLTIEQKLAAKAKSMNKQSA